MFSDVEVKAFEEILDDYGKPLQFNAGSSPSAFQNSFEISATRENKSLNF